MWLSLHSSNKLKFSIAANDMLFETPDTCHEIFQFYKKNCLGKFASLDDVCWFQLVEKLSVEIFQFHYFLKQIEQQTQINLNLQLLFLATNLDFPHNG